MNDMRFAFASALAAALTVVSLAPQSGAAQEPAGRLASAVERLGWPVERAAYAGRAAGTCRASG